MMEICNEDSNGMTLHLVHPNRLSFLLEDEDESPVEITKEDNDVDSLHLVEQEEEKVDSLHLVEVEDETIEATDNSVLDKSFTLRQLIASRFNTNDETSTCNASLLVRAILGSLKSNDLELDNLEGYTSILQRALLPAETENPFLNMEEFETALQICISPNVGLLNSCDEEALDQQRLSYPSDDATLDVSTEWTDDFDWSNDPIEEALSEDLHQQTSRINESDANEAVGFSLLSKLESLERPHQNSHVGQVLFGRYSITDTIDKGDACTVYAATDLKFDRIVAIKQVSAPRSEAASAFNKAIEEYKSFQHPNLIRFLDSRSIDDVPCLILEYVEGETLSSLLTRIGHIKTEAQIGQTALQLCSLLIYLHGKDYAHGNLSTRSIILVKANGETTIKVGGFCSSKVLNDSIVLSDSLDQPTAEQTKKDHIKSDVNTVAAIIYEMVTGIELHEEDHQDDKELVAISALRPELFELDFLKEMLKRGLSKTDGFKSIDHFQNAIRSWMERINREFASTKPVDQTPKSSLKDLVRKEPRDQETYMPVSKRWAKPYRGIKFIEEELQKELNTLKTNQIKNEATVAMRVSRALCAKRQRKSPIKTIAEVAVISTCTVLTCAATINFLTANFDNIKAKYFVVARALSKPAVKNLSETEQQIEFLDYRQDSAYKRWSNTKQFGQPRRIEANCQLREK